ncbi:hypothetical protein GCM10022409_28340 [Hymenobacter glaciei]|uniref:Lipoprotein n=1 Tax=Hymenobacter glaciei TaxID=877209 RepID=A0ABP7UFB5_9BACT
MKNSLLILAGAAALSLASCSQEKTTEVATTDGAAGTTTTTTTTTTSAPMSEADIQARAQRIADKMAANMKITDEAMKTKIRTVYVNRYNRMNEMRTKYGTDTTGMAVAMRESNMSTDTEFKTVFTDPTQYQAYESSRTTYYDEDNAPMDNMSSDMSNSSSDMSNSSSDMSGSKMSADGGKMKVKADGDIKIKDADGNKMKIDGDDGTIKSKPAEGEKTKIK